MAALDAASALAAAHRIVIKVGSALLVDWDSGRPHEGALAALAADVARLRTRGQQVLVVSSGAVAMGRKRLGLPARALSLDQRQAAAAAGQSLLMHAWESALAPHGLHAAQILLTRDDTETRRRWLNARATVEALLGLGAVPIVNENDTVATEEIRYGDNDRLAARAAQMIGADLLALLSDVDGLYDADPRSNPSAKRLDVIAALTPEVEAMAGGAGSPHGTGGMATKLMAARIAGAAGCSTLIALGRQAGSGPLEAVESGAANATLILAPTTPRAAYKRWIAGSLAPRGVLIVDDGCAAALGKGASLLAAGLRSVEGGFEKGDAVTIRDLHGRSLGSGLARLDALHAARVAGLRSDAIESALGWAAGPIVVHADDLALGD